MTEPTTHVEPTQAEPAKPSLSVEAGTMAILSGLVFGGLGAWGGRVLGSKGGNQGPRLLGRTFWTWAGGLATGLVAAYTALKTHATHASEKAELKEVTEDLSDATAALLKENHTLRAMAQPQAVPEHAAPKAQLALEEAVHLGAVATPEKHIQAAL